MSYEVYMHGQVLGSHIFKLKGEFVQPDAYSEIAQKYFLPGGKPERRQLCYHPLG